MAAAGDKPGAGIYTCNNCGHPISLESDSEALPACPSCKGMDYTG